MPLENSLLLQLAVKEIGRGVVGREPVAVQEKVMHFVREDELLELDVLLAEPPREVNHLAEGDVAVVVALNQKDGRAPLLDGGDGRGFERDLLRVAAVVVNPGSAGDALRPVVAAVPVNSGGEEVGVARESEGRQVPAVGAAPESD